MLVSLKSVSNGQNSNKYTTREPILRYHHDNTSYLEKMVFSVDWFPVLQPCDAGSRMPADLALDVAPSWQRLARWTVHAQRRDHGVTCSINVFILRPKQKILCFGQPDPTYSNLTTLDFFYENTGVFFVGVFIIEVSLLKKFFFKSADPT